ncbi:TRAP transporter small permease [Histidinibacterium aquaticum]|uniref:TRAP transporter small permease protein n=2 Tax=Histidinibacterium aquaticum TaxID=2613962 RepID=A0A5J5GMG9_9RHOB|nr:TRAP transporter small permease [Histidinibacterium aquaticum]
MFLSFIVQVFMRYVLDNPVGWTVEVCVIAWLWILFWGQSVSASEEDEIRFDIVYGAVSPAVRRWFRVVFSVFLVGIYLWSLPAVWDFVSFMQIQDTSYLDIPFSWVFSIAVVFMVVSILRYARIFWSALRGHDPHAATPDPGTVSRKDFTE